MNPWSNRCLGGLWAQMSGFASTLGRSQIHNVQEISRTRQQNIESIRTTGAVMLKKIDPTRTKSWQALASHFNEMKDIHMKDLFHEDARRFEKFSLRFRDIVVDYSKNRVTENTLDLLIQLADEVHLADAIEKMFQGDRINETENRAVLHVALRNRHN